MVSDGLGSAPQRVPDEEQEFRYHVGRVTAAAHEAAARRFSVHDLVGLSLGDAQRRVQALGGLFQTFDEPLAATVDFNRVVVHVEEGHVVDADVG